MPERVPASDDRTFKYVVLTGLGFLIGFISGVMAGGLGVSVGV